MAKAETIDFPYMNDQQGEYIKDGVTNGNTHNYDYGNVAGVSFDSEGYVNYDNKAYVKKSVKENAETQGLFDVTLDVKGNDINPPRDIDLVLVIDFSSTMSGEKLLNTQNAVHQFLTSIAEVLQEGHVRVGLVCYNRNLYSTQTFSTDANYLDDFLVNGAKSQSGTFTQNGNKFTIKNTFIGTTTEPPTTEPPTTESSTTTGSSSEITNSTSNEDTKRDSKHLPNAGEKVTKTALVGLFFIILALIFVFARKFMLKNKEKK
ncbi:vWA domain-containing protein [Lactococcus garvieae]|uniref:vWA domain-containing protein n=1 Tax=Lactococcus garvieae TaxID=1363 RepID=UPI003D76E465